MDLQHLLAAPKVPKKSVDVLIKSFNLGQSDPDHTPQISLIQATVDFALSTMLRRSTHAPRGALRSMTGGQTQQTATAENDRTRIQRKPPLPSEAKQKSRPTPAGATAARKDVAEGAAPVASKETTSASSRRQISRGVSTATSKLPPPPAQISPSANAENKNPARSSGRAPTSKIPTPATARASVVPTPATAVSPTENGAVGAAVGCGTTTPSTALLSPAAVCLQDPTLRVASMQQN